MIECKFEDKILIMSDDIKDIKKDVRNLLQFKWQIVGVVGFATLLTSLLISYFLK